jgi:hypothetical protein
MTRLEIVYKFLQALYTTITKLPKDLISTLRPSMSLLQIHHRSTTMLLRSRLNFMNIFSIRESTTWLMTFL